MILQELVRYYDRKAADPDPSRRLPAFGFVDKAIPFVIEIAPDGRVIQLIDTRAPDSGTGKPRAQSFLVPRGVKKTSQVAANLLWDSAEYVIGLDRGRANLSPSPSAAFRGRIEKLPAPANADDGIVAVLQALRRADWSVVHRHPAWREITETNPLMAFRLVGDLDLICQRPAVAAAVASADGDDDGDPAPILPCLVDGTPQPVERLHDPIKGVWNAQSSGGTPLMRSMRPTAIASSVHGHPRCASVTRAPGIDVSSGVETAPGVKNIDMIQLFISRAREAVRALA